MGFFSSRDDAKAQRPKDVKVLQIFKTGAQQNCIEFKLNEARAYYLQRPDDNQRQWDYILSKGNQSFYVAPEGPLFRIHRNQQDASIQYFSAENELIFTLNWAGRGDAGGLTAAPREHFFFHKGAKYEWTDKSHTTGIDMFCRCPESKETIAYFRAVLLPTEKIGKLELKKNIDEGLEDYLVATFLGYREWSIRRQLLIYGDDWFNQSVSG